MTKLKFLARNLLGVPEGWEKSFTFSKLQTLNGQPWITKEEYIEHWGNLLKSDVIFDSLRVIEQFKDCEISEPHFEYLINSALFLKTKHSTQSKKDSEAWLNEVGYHISKLKNLLYASDIQSQRYVNDFISSSYVSETIGSESLTKELGYIQVLESLNKDAVEWAESSSKPGRPGDSSYRQTYFVKQCAIEFNKLTQDPQFELVADLTSILFSRNGYSTSQVARIFKNR